MIVLILTVLVMIIATVYKFKNNHLNNYLLTLLISVLMIISNIWLFCEASIGLVPTWIPFLILGSSAAWINSFFSIGKTLDDYGQNILEQDKEYYIEIEGWAYWYKKIQPKIGDFYIQKDGGGASCILRKLESPREFTDNIRMLSIYNSYGYYPYHQTKNDTKHIPILGTIIKSTNPYINNHIKH